VPKFMRRAVLALMAVTCLALGSRDSEVGYRVAGWGGHPVSADLTSLWLTSPASLPLIIVYFHGPEGWHKTHWEISAKFEMGKPGWVDLTSEKAKLHVWLDLDTGQAEVQSEKVSLRDANTYLVLDVIDSKRQKVIPLGVMNLPKSTAEPASILLLRDNPGLAEKIQKEIANAAGA
jgi:hypothetical protein